MTAVKWMLNTLHSGCCYYITSQHYLSHNCHLRPARGHYNYGGKAKLRKLLAHRLLECGNYGLSETDATGTRGSCENPARTEVGSAKCVTQTDGLVRRRAAGRKPSTLSLPKIVLIYHIRIRDSFTLISLLLLRLLPLLKDG